MHVPYWQRDDHGIPCSLSVRAGPTTGILFQSIVIWDFTQALELWFHRGPRLTRRAENVASEGLS